MVSGPNCFIQTVFMSAYSHNLDRLRHGVFKYYTLHHRMKEVARKVVTWEQLVQVGTAKVCTVLGRFLFHLPARAKMGNEESY